LSFISDKEVALIQDEDGKIFYFDLEKGVVTRKITFGKDGDYEDLKIAGDTAYILRSDGKIYEITNLSGTSSGIVKNKYVTGLSSQNDTEGLCYDAKHNRLLVACKGSPGTDEKYKNNKAIYSFDLASKKMSSTPVYLINVNRVEKLAHGSQNSVIHNFMKLYRKIKENTFQPSGISIHPITGDIYVISSAGNLLVVLDSLGTIKNVEKLPSGVFKQPEGIGFDSKGNLYISNEGRKGKGNILKFLYLTEHLNS
jgi:DNA-binding beta-propeller fold protein YncE